MTEEEAKTKWCPMVSMKIIQENVHGENRINNLNQEKTHAYMCIASDCMMWVSQTKDTEWKTINRGTSREQEIATKTKIDGHCGLAK